MKAIEAFKILKVMIVKEKTASSIMFSFILKSVVWDWHRRTRILVVSSQQLLNKGDRMLNYTFGIKSVGLCVVLITTNVTCHPAPEYFMPNRTTTPQHSLCVWWSWTFPKCSLKVPWISMSTLSARFQPIAGHQRSRLTNRRPTRAC